jgi:chromosome segregation ATPase
MRRRDPKMTSLEATLKRILDKLQQLMRRHKALHQENDRLRRTVGEAEEKLKQAQEQVQLLRTQLDVLKLNAGDLNAADKKEIEKKLNGYLKEIDRCIALLSE